MRFIWIDSIFEHILDQNRDIFVLKICVRWNPLHQRYNYPKVICFRSNCKFLFIVPSHSAAHIFGLTLKMWDIFVNLFKIWCHFFVPPFLSRKRSRDEDTCDFMPISKRINNLTLTSQNLGEQDSSAALNFNSNAPVNNFMAINDQDIQSQHFAHHALANSYSNGMSHHYLIPGQTAHNPNYQQSPVQQSTNHSNDFHNGSHLAAGTNAHKQNQHQHHHHHQQQQQQQQMHHPTHLNNAEQNNNEMEDVYCPELTPDENPFYYDKNKLLFDLHVERQRRHQGHH